MKRPKPATNGWDAIESVARVCLWLGLAYIATVHGGCKW